jgi:hypothetical protein
LWLWLDRNARAADAARRKPNRDRGDWATGSECEPSALIRCGDERSLRWLSDQERAAGPGKLRSFGELPPQDDSPYKRQKNNNYR